MKERDEGDFNPALRNYLRTVCVACLPSRRRHKRKCPGCTLYKPRREFSLEACGKPRRKCDKCYASARPRKAVSRRCITCGLDKSAEEFRQSKSPSHYRKRCKACQVPTGTAADCYFCKKTLNKARQVRLKVDGQKEPVITCKLCKLGRTRLYRCEHCKEKKKREHFAYSDEGIKARNCLQCPQRAFGRKFQRVSPNPCEECGAQFMTCRTKGSAAQAKYCSKECKAKGQAYPVLCEFCLERKSAAAVRPFEGGPKMACRSCMASMSSAQKEALRIKSKVDSLFTRLNRRAPAPGSTGIRESLIIKKMQGNCELCGDDCATISLRDKDGPCNHDTVVASCDTCAKLLRILPFDVLREWGRAVADKADSHIKVVYSRRGRQSKQFFKEIAPNVTHMFRTKES